MEIVSEPSILRCSCTNAHNQDSTSQMRRRYEPDDQSWLANLHQNSEARMPEMYQHWTQMRRLRASQNVVVRTKSRNESCRTLCSRPGIADFVQQYRRTCATMVSGADRTYAVQLL